MILLVVDAAVYIWKWPLLWLCVFAIPQLKIQIK